MQSDEPLSGSKLSLSRNRFLKRQRDILSPTASLSQATDSSRQEERTPVSKKIRGYDTETASTKLNRPDENDSDNASINLLTQPQEDEDDDNASDNDEMTEPVPRRSPFVVFKSTMKSFFSRWSDPVAASESKGKLNKRTPPNDLITPKRSGSRISMFSSLSPILSQSPLFRTPKSLQVRPKSDENEPNDIDVSSNGDSQLDPVEIQSQTPYLDKVERNKKRNEDKLKQLGFLPQNGLHNDSFPSPEDDIEEEYIIQEEDDEVKNGCTGMIFPTTCNTSFHNSKYSSTSIPLEDIYPHRNKQINLLRGLCSSSIRQIDFTNAIQGTNGIDDEFELEAYVPTPIFCTGPSGSGKTSIVLDVLVELKNEKLGLWQESSDTKAKVAIAYIDCSVAEAHKSGASGILENAYHQIHSQLNRFSKKISKSTKQNKLFDSEILAENSLHYDSFDVDDHSISDGGFDEDLTHGSDVEVSTNIQSNIDNDDDEEDWISHEATKYMSNQDTLSQPKLEKAYSFRRRSSRLGGTAEVEKTNENRSISSFQFTKKQNKLSTGQLNTPIAFGRSIKQFIGATQYNKFQRGCAFLILDRAERLLSLSSTSFSEKTNFLSQLLLLPRVLSLNLTVIVITDKVLLEYTRINNVVRPNNVTGTISEAIVPFRIHFDAYKGTQEFRDILTTPHMRQLVICDIDGKLGDSTERLLIQSLHASMIEIVVQSVEGITRDVGEITRLSRIAWPIFTAPLYQKADLKNAFFQHILDHNHILKGEILEKLGQYFRPHIKHLISRCLLQPGYVISANAAESQSVSVSLPYLSKFLLLSAYLCQNNTPDKDATLFTSQRKGRRKNIKSFQNDSISYASTHSTRKQILSERLSSFPLERMLSIFSSICNKYGNGLDAGVIRSMTGKDISLRAEKLGSLSLFKSISDLKAMGLLEEVGLNSAFDDDMMYSRGVTSTKYICNLSRSQAELIANDIEFPLLEYLTAS